MTHADRPPAASRGDAGELTNGSGGFTTTTAANYQFGGPGPTSATAADLNREGRKDLVVFSLATPAPQLTVLAGNGTPGLSKGLHVWAQHLWWGKAGGPGFLSALGLGGTVDTRSPLAESPAWCG